MAVIGGALFGFATGATMPSFVSTSHGEGPAIGGLVAGIGVGLIAAALVKE